MSNEFYVLWSVGHGYKEDSIAAFRLACRSQHWRFEGDICKTVQAPLAAEGRPASCQSMDNLAALPKAADHRQLASIQLESDAAQ